MRLVRMLALAGLMGLAACSSSPTEPDVTGRVLGGAIVVPAHQPKGSDEPCKSMGKLALKCVRT